MKELKRETRREKQCHAHNEVKGPVCKRVIRSRLLHSTVVSPEMSRDQPRLLAALNMASTAIANVGFGKDVFFCHLRV